MFNKRKAGTGMLSQQAAGFGKVKRPADGLLDPGHPPSPAGSIVSTTSRDGPPSAKKRRGNDRTPIYVAPTTVTTGNTILSQLTFAVDFLKGKKGEPQTLDTITSYLSVREEDRVKELVQKMRMYSGITYDPPETVSDSEEDWRLGTYSHRAKLPGVRDKTTLIAFLQKRTDPTGVQVKDIKDGWPKCDQDLAELEKEHKILVTRTKKDGQARAVWLDMSNMHHDVDPKVKARWLKVALPTLDDTPAELQKAGQIPTSSLVKVKRQAPKAEKKKKARKSTNITNRHMGALEQALTKNLG